MGVIIINFKIGAGHHDTKLVLDAPTVEKGIENLIDVMMAEADEDAQMPDYLQVFSDRWDSKNIDIKYDPNRTIKEVLNGGKPS